MPSNTSFAQLYLYNNTTDKETLFSEFRERLAGTAETSNMQKIDKLLSQDNDRITNLENSPSILTARATTSDAGNNFVVTIEGFTEYKQDMIMAIYLSQNNVGLTTININNIGTKSLMKISEDGSIVNLEADDLKKNVGYLFQYDGTQFVLLQEVTVKDLYKTFLEFEETDEVVPPAPIDVDMLGGIPAANYLQKIYNAGSNNLLVNPRFKYNGRDQSSYTGTVWGLDGWYCANITQTGNILTSSSADSAIQQPIKGADMLLGKTATISIAVQGQDIAQTSCSIPSPAPSSTITFGSTTTSWGSISLWYDSSASQIKFSINVSNGQSITINGVKLELGSTSTLQADLDNPPSEDIEKLKLDMYDLDPGRCAYLPWHNENLLDNWYFIGGGSQQNGGQFPINQRGETSYSGTALYSIDRWKLSQGTTETVNIESNGISISTLAVFVQVFENLGLQNGETITLSAVIDGVLISGSTTYNASSPYISVVEADGFRLAIDPQNKYFQLYNSSGTSENLIQAVKLEKGYLSTLARKDESGSWVLNDPPPNFQQELAKCQRYLLVPSNSSDIYPSVGIGTTFTANDAQILIPLPVSMRVKPTVTMNGNWTLRGGGGALPYLPDGSYSAVASTLSPSVATIIINATGVTLPINQAVELLRNNDPTGQLILSADL